MGAKAETTRVAFRVDKSGKFKGTVTAVLPDFPEDNGFTCYAHVGQHGTCSRAWIWSKTRPATEAEYKELLNELKQIGYENIRVIRRIQR